MGKKVEITNNLGVKKMVSEEFALTFNKAKDYSKSLGKNFGDSNEVPIEEFSNDFKETEDKTIKKSYTEWL